MHVAVVCLMSYASCLWTCGTVPDLQDTVQGAMATHTTQ